MKIFKPFLLAILLLIFFSRNSNSQTMFQKTFGTIGIETPHKVLQTKDSGYIFTGSTDLNSTGNEDVFLIKTDINGDTLWTKTYGYNELDNANDIIEVDSGYILIGNSNSFSNGTEIQMIRTDNYGIVNWVKEFGYTNGYAAGQKIIYTNDGGYMILGTTYNFGGAGVYLIKLNNSGAVVWNKVFYDNNSYCFALDIKQIVDSSYGITGTISDINVPGDDAFLLNVDKNGNIKWAKTVVCNGNNSGQSLLTTIDSCLIIAGFADSSSSNNTDVYLLKVNFNGDTIWSRTLDATGDEDILKIMPSSNNNFIAIGSSRNLSNGLWEIYLLQFDSFGFPVWSKKIGDPAKINLGSSIAQTFDKGYIIEGYTEDPIAGNKDIYLIKTDFTGATGCNDSDVVTTVSSIGTQINNLTLLIDSINQTTFPPAIYVNNFFNTSTLCFTSGLTEPNIFSSIILYPNPSSNWISFKGWGLISKVKIFNIYGQLLKTQNHILTEEKININDLLPGLYLVSYDFNNKNYCTKLIRH